MPIALGYPRGSKEHLLGIEEYRRRKLQRHSALMTNRSSLDVHWQDMTRHLLPRSGRFFSQERDRSGRHLYNRIFDNTGTRSVRILGAGLMAGATSPARPWFKLTTPDPDLAHVHEVELWLDDVVRRMQRVFAASNVYRTLHTMYEELAVYGTSVALILPDFDNVVHLQPVVAGEYCLQQNHRGHIDTLYRKFTRTIWEVVQEYGLEACSVSVKQQFREGNYENPVDILHVIEPRSVTERDLDNPTAQHMPWASCHLELTNDGSNNSVLRESGFKTFPVLSPRWAVDGGDVYGHSPGMEALGDVRQLQHEQFRKGQAIDFKIRPPLQVPSSLKDRDNEMFPGGVSYYESGMLLPHDQVTPHGGIRSAFEVNLELDHLLLDIQDVRERIRGAFHADLFLMLSLAGTNTRMTATEVAERHEEKLLMLGPTLERLHNELLQPLIDRTFETMLEAGAIPPPPPDLYGVELSVEFVSILAQAQRMVGSASIDRFVGNVLNVAQAKPDVLDTVDFDEWSSGYGTMLGVPASMRTAPEERDRIRKARAEAQAAQEQLAMQREQAAMMKDLAAAPTGGGGTALSDTIDVLSQDDGTQL